LAKFFDEMKLYIQSFSTLNKLSYDNIDSMPNDFLSVFARNEGIDLPPLFVGSSIEQYIEGQNLDNSTSVKNIRYVFNTPRDINGTYLFTYTPIDSVNGTSSINYGYAVFSLEFIASWIYLASSSKPCHIQSSASCVSSQPRGLRP
jgi:hypothetical protein